MLDHAIESGVTYIDTAYPYHDGESEPFVGRVLKKYKEKIFILRQSYQCLKLIHWNKQKKSLKNK